MISYHISSRALLLGVGFFALILMSGFVFFAMQKAFADEPPPTIKFKGLDKEGCKVFNVTDKDGHRTGYISKVEVSAWPGMIKKPKSQPEGAYIQDGNSHIFDYTYELETPSSVIITVCGNRTYVLFWITAWDIQKPPKNSTIEVQEVQRRAEKDGNFTLEFIVRKEYSPEICKKIKVQTDNVENVTVNCSWVISFGVNVTKVTVSGNLINKAMPGTAALIVDPPVEVFLLVVEVLPFASTPATIDIVPDSLNLRSKGKLVTACIELPEGYNVGDINVSSILLNDTIAAEMHPVSIGDYDSDDIPDLMVKFDRAEVISYIDTEERFMSITLTVAGYLNDATHFQGSDVIRTILAISR